MAAVTRSNLRAGIGLSLLLWPLVSYAGQANDARVVASLFPAQLTIESAIFTDPPVTEYSFQRADLEGTGGADYVVALYTNTISSVLSVIRPTADGGVVVASSTGLRIGGGSGKLTLRDIDGDSRPEIFASVRFNRGVETWIFAWRRRELVWIGPSAACADGTARTAVGDPEVSDLDGDGVLELVEPSFFPNDAHDEGAVFALSNGRYSKRTTIRFTRSYLRGTGRPVIQSATFAGVDGSGDFELRIVNGDDFGEHRTSSAVVRLNGVVAAGPDLFKPRTRNIVIPVVLRTNNRLEVEMSGAPDSAISVLVERKTPAPQAAKRIAPSER